MGPLPKRKLSRRRKHNRRSHDALARRHLIKCANCEAWVPSHHVCQNCGTYNGHTVFILEETKS